MADDIPFDKDLNLTPGKVDQAIPGVRRLLCNNPSPFTFKGTVSYIVGEGNVAIIDPGPDDPAHIAALLDAVRGETVTHIFVTHTHRDHSPAVPAVKAATGALVLAEGPHRARRARSMSARLRAWKDQRHRLQAGPRARGRRGGQRFRLDDRGGGDAGPHQEPHGVRLKEKDVLFSGDHVMAWSTPVVAPPDGSMGDYMASLDKLRERSEQVYFPGHGGAVTNAPRFVAAYILHRKAREAAIVRQLEKGESDIPSLVGTIYANLDPRLTRAAGMSVLAHLEDLVARGTVMSDGPPSIAGRYRFAG